MKGKKGGVIDGLTSLVILFAFALFFLVVFNALDDVNTDIQSDPDISSDGKEIIDDYHTNYPTWLDNAFLFIFTGLWIVSLISSFYIDTQPAFLVFSILLLIIVLVISAYLSNGYQELMEDSTFEDTITLFPITDFVLSHIVEFFIGIIFTNLIVFFAKTRL